MLKKLSKAIILILALLGVFFIILMIMPDDEESESNYDGENEISEDLYAEENDGDMSEATEDVVTHMGQDNDAGNTFENGVSKKVQTNPEAVEVGTDAKSATIMIYMNGSDLESESGEATEDISEMLESEIGENVNVIIQTMGTRQWQDYDISSDTAQTYCIEKGELKLVRDNLGQLDSTSEDTLSEYINFCKRYYPADRYMFIFWNHGGGPVYGFGYDEWQSEEDSLTISEMAEAFSENNDIHFDIIGMDCCIMANLETCYALEPFCKYTLLSEDFESGIGWFYTDWMNKFEKNPGMSTPLLGKYIVDDMINANENSFFGESVCMGLFNEAAVKDLFDAWKLYAYKNEEALLNTNYSRSHKAKGRGSLDLWEIWDSDESDVTLSDYYISDMLAIIESVDMESDEAKNLMSALKASVAYYGHSSDKNELTGLSVSLPYGDMYFYDQLKMVYSGLGFDSEYINWLGGFVTAFGNNDFYDYGTFEDTWGGWGEYESEYGCNGSGGSCEYGYDYEESDDEYYDYNDDESNDDWIYDHDEKLWYLYEGDTLYLYDDEIDMMYYYDEYEDIYYYYDEHDEEWYPCE